MVKNEEKIIKEKIKRRADSILVSFENGGPQAITEQLVDSDSSRHERKQHSFHHSSISESTISRNLIKNPKLSDMEIQFKSADPTPKNS